MPFPALVILALAYSGLVLATLAHALRKVMPAPRAVLVAFAISAVVHAASTFLGTEQDRWFTLSLFWLLPHLLFVPVLLLAARYQRP